MLNPFTLSLRNIAGSPFRSGMVLVCVALVAGSGMWAASIVQGARADLRLSVNSMDGPVGDIVVIPRASGHSSVGIENVDLEALLKDIRAIPGVSLASPQLRFLTMLDSPYCPNTELFLVAFDPVTDFSVSAWLPNQAGMEIGPGESITGNRIAVPPGEQGISLAGHALTVLAQLPATGSSLDSTIFVTFETAEAMFLQAREDPDRLIDTNSIPTILVKFHPEYDPHAVTAKILKDIPGISVIDQADYFQYGYDQLSGMLGNLPALMGMIWLLSVLFIGMVFTITVNERRREIGLLRSLGCTRVSIFRLLLTEGFVLALGGGLLAIIPGILMAGLFSDWMINFMDLPLAAPSVWNLFGLAAGSLLLAMTSVTLAVFLPAWRISHEDPAVALRG